MEGYFILGWTTKNSRKLAAMTGFKFLALIMCQLILMLVVVTSSWSVEKENMHIGGLC